MVLKGRAHSNPFPSFIFRRLPSYTRVCRVQRTPTYNVRVSLIYVIKGLGGGVAFQLVCSFGRIDLHNIYVGVEDGGWVLLTRETLGRDNLVLNTSLGVLSVS